MDHIGSFEEVRDVDQSECVRIVLTEAVKQTGKSLLREPCVTPVLCFYLEEYSRPPSSL